MRKMNDRLRCNAEKMRRVAVRIIIGASLSLAAAGPSFAAITDVGQNFGTWIQDQGFYVALGVVVISLIPMIAKKAWVPLVTFVIIGALILSMIKSPDSLATWGDSIRGVLSK